MLGLFVIEKLSLILSLFMSEITTIAITSQNNEATQVASKGDPPTLFFNTHLTAKMWISQRSSFQPLGGTFSTLIGPLGSVTIQPLADLFVTTDTDGAQLSIIPGGVNDTASPAAIAQQINTLGLATATNQSSQIGQGTTQINNQNSQITAAQASMGRTNSLDTEVSNGYFTHVDGSATLAGVWSAISAGDVIDTAGINATAALPPGSTFTNGCRITVPGTNTQDGVFGGTHSVIGGEQIAASAWIRPHVSGSNFSLQLVANFYDNTATFISSQIFTQGIVNSLLWVKVKSKGTITVPSNAAGVAWSVGITAAVGNVTAGIFYVCGVVAHSVQNSGTVATNHALSRSVIGNPLLHGVDQITTYATSLAANSAIDLGPFTLNKPGYLINIRPQYTGASGALPFILVRMRWTTGNLEIGYQEWILPVLPNGNYCPIIGQGPIRAQKLLITINNLDPAQAVTPFFDIWESTHHIARDDWRTATVFGYIGPPGFNAPPGANRFSTNELIAVTGQALAASASTNFLLPAYAGEVFLNFVAGTGQLVNVTFQVPTILPSFAGGGAGIFSDTAGGGTFRLIFPRCPVLVGVANPSSTAAIVWSMFISTQEYAS